MKSFFINKPNSINICFQIWKLLAPLHCLKVHWLRWWFELYSPLRYKVNYSKVGNKTSLRWWAQHSVVPSFAHQQVQVNLNFRWVWHVHMLAPQTYSEDLNRSCLGRIAHHTIKHFNTPQVLKIICITYLLARKYKEYKINVWFPNRWGSALSLQLSSLVV